MTLKTTKRPAESGAFFARRAIVSTAIAGCLAWSAMASAQAGSAAQSASPSNAAPQVSADRWSVLGRSVEDRVIEYRQFGQGEEQVLIVGPLEGDETAGLELVESLAEHLEKFPRRGSQVKVTLVRDPNPDGRLRRSPGNAHGVRLDQNFPTRGWHKVPSGANWLSGREPESEPETRVLVDLLDDVQPDRVIILATTRRQAELNYFGPAEEMSRQFAMAASLRPASGNVASQQGSLAVYAGVDRKTPTIVVRVPTAMRRDQLWATYKRALLKVIGGQDDSAPQVADAPIDAKEQEARRIPALSTVLATPKAIGEGVSPTKEKAGRHIFSADELQPGGELVPLVRPQTATASKRNTASSADQQQIAPPPATSKPLTRQAPFAAVPYRGNSFPPATLYRQAPTAEPLLGVSQPAATAPAAAKNVQRLPAVNSASPAKKTLPQPIPLYPATGY